MAIRLSSVHDLFPVMRPELVPLWCDEDRNARRIEQHQAWWSYVL